jgi:hypothetical protein
MQVCPAYVQLAEASLSVVTQNLNYQWGALKDQDKILRGLEARLDHVQDHLGIISIELSLDFKAPTLNARVALLAETFSSLENPENPANAQMELFCHRL